MMKHEPWYEVVASSSKLTQGDLIFDCPLLTWSTDVLPLPSLTTETELLRRASQVFRADVVVMTQACDLEHNKVRHVVLCPHVPLATFRAKWEQVPGKWRRFSNFSKTLGQEHPRRTTAARKRMLS